MELPVEEIHDADMGAIMGTFIGDALGLGCHWYYDLQSLKADYGPWVSNYVTSKPDRGDGFGKIAKYRYEVGLRAGDISQTGERQEQWGQSPSLDPSGRQDQKEPY